MICTLVCISLCCVGTPDCDVVDVVAAPAFDVSVLCIVSVCVSCGSVYVPCLFFVCLLSIETVWDRFAKRSYCT